MVENVKRPAAPLSIVLVLLLGLILRGVGLWWGQGYFYFGQGDGLEAYSVAVDFGKGEPLAQYIGQPNYNSNSKLPGPLWTVFCWLGLRLWGSIEGVMVASICLNTAAIYLVYLLANRTVGPTAAFWAAVFTATLPSPVFYSLGVYNPEVMPFLGACLALALWEVLQHERSRHIFWVPLLLLMMLQFHMSGLVLCPAAILLLLLSPVRLNRGWALAGCLAGALLYMPYVLGDCAHGWQNTRGMLSGRRGYSWDELKALTVPFNLLVNLVPQWTRSSAEYRELGRACFGWFGVLVAINLVSVLVVVFVTCGAVRKFRLSAAGFWRSPRTVLGRAAALPFLAILLVVPLLSALATGAPFHARYALVLLPPLLVLAGVGAAHWLPSSGSEKASKPLNRLFAIALVFTTCANIWFMPAFYWHQRAAIRNGEVFIPSFRQLELVYQDLKAHAGGNRPVQVESADYLHALAPNDEARRAAGFIRVYTAIREKESAKSGTASPPLIYKLVQVDGVSPTDLRVAYRAHNIALVAQTSAQ